MIPETNTLSQVFDTFLRERAHIMLVVDEYGCMEGIVPLEDIMETLIGLEIIDEGDHATDMQEYARSHWRKRARDMGIEIEE